MSTPLTVFITGGASGIGAACAQTFAHHGWNVGIGDLPSTKSNAEALISSFSSKAIFIPLDVTSEQSIKDAVAEMVKVFGRLDAAVNCAGIGGNLGFTHSCPTEEYDRVYNVNQRGVFLSMREELIAMRQQSPRDAGPHAAPNVRFPSRGSIVNVASLAGLLGFPNGSAYGDTKHAVNGMTKSAGLGNVKEGIRVNSVCPGFVATPMVLGSIEKGLLPREKAEKFSPMERIAEPAEVAAAIYWLASDDASFVNATNMVIDGGAYAGRG